MIQILQCFILALVVFGVSGGSQVAARSVPEHWAKKSGDFVFEAQPKVIAAGETVVLHWAIKGATKVVIEEQMKSSDTLHNLGTFGGSGTVEVRPVENTTYIVTCEGSTTLSCASVSVRVRVKRR